MNQTKHQGYNDPNHRQCQDETANYEGKHKTRSIACNRGRRGAPYEAPVGFLKGKNRAKRLNYYLARHVPKHFRRKFNGLTWSARIASQQNCRTSTGILQIFDRGEVLWDMPLHTPPLEEGCAEAFLRYIQATNSSLTRSIQATTINRLFL